MSTIKIYEGHLKMLRYGIINLKTEKEIYFCYIDTLSDTQVADERNHQFLHLSPKGR